MVAGSNGPSSLDGSETDAGEYLGPAWLGRGLATRALIQHLVELRALAVMGPVYGRQAAVFFRLRRCLAP